VKNPPKVRRRSLINYTKWSKKVLNLQSERVLSRTLSPFYKLELDKAFFSREEYADLVFTRSSDFDKFIQLMYFWCVKKRWFGYNIPLFPVG
jgi:hypothetical protein